MKRLAASSILLVFVAACDRGATGSTDGPAVFASVCATCHGATGKPAEAMVARLGVRDLTDPSVRTRLSAAHVEQQIRKGSQNKLMPSFQGALTDAQIKAVAEYVASDSFVKR